MTTPEAAATGPLGSSGSREGCHLFVEGSVDDAMSFICVLSLPFALDALAPHLAAALDGDPATSEPPMT
jgi:iron complex transport system substrate-binding protein